MIENAHSTAHRPASSSSPQTPVSSSSPQRTGSAQSASALPTSRVKHVQQAPRTEAVNARHRPMAPHRPGGSKEGTGNVSPKVKTQSGASQDAARGGSSSDVQQRVEVRFRRYAESLHWASFRHMCKNRGEYLWMCQSVNKELATELITILETESTAALNRCFDNLQEPLLGTLQAFATHDFLSCLSDQAREMCSASVERCCTHTYSLLERRLQQVSKALLTQREDLLMDLLALKAGNCLAEAYYEAATYRGTGSGYRCRERVDREILRQRKFFGCTVDDLKIEETIAALRASLKEAVLEPRCGTRMAKRAPTPKCRRRQARKAGLQEAKESVAAPSVAAERLAAGYVVATAAGKTTRMRLYLLPPTG
ncbi:hypothetical protein ACQY0O_006229 [Thecaphora frezii]